MSMLLSNGGWVVVAMFFCIVPFIACNLCLEGRDPYQYPVMRWIARISGILIFVLFIIGLLVYDLGC